MKTVFPKIMFRVKKKSVRTGGMFSNALLQDRKCVVFHSNAAGPPVGGICLPRTISLAAAPCGRWQGGGHGVRKQRNHGSNRGTETFRLGSTNGDRHGNRGCHRKNNNRVRGAGRAAEGGERPPSLPAGHHPENQPAGEDTGWVIRSFTSLFGHQ